VLHRTIHTDWVENDTASQITADVIVLSENAARFRVDIAGPA
jgi:hypothetical protein